MFDFFSNGTGRKLIGYNLDLGGEDEDDVWSIPGDHLSLILRHCDKGTLRFIPVTYQDEAEANLAVAIPQKWQLRKCHPFGKNTYIKVRAAHPKTGLLPGDIVVAIQGKVPKMLDCFEEEAVLFTVIRGGGEETISVATLHIDNFHSDTVVSCYGMMVEEAPIQLAMTTKSDGLYISSVAKHSPAASWDVPEPSFLVELNNCKVGTTDEVVRQLQSLKTEQQGIIE